MQLKVEEHLEVWNDYSALEFPRFTSETATQVCYHVLKNATNPGNTLTRIVKRPEEMASELGNQISLRRTDMLEHRLNKLEQRHVVPKGKSTDVRE